MRLDIAQVTDITDVTHPLAARPGMAAASCNVLASYTPVVGEWVAVLIDGGNWLILGKVAT
jgi:hypothetical protein